MAVDVVFCIAGFDSKLAVDVPSEFPFEVCFSAGVSASSELFSVSFSLFESSESLSEIASFTELSETPPVDCRALALVVAMCWAAAGSTGLSWFAPVVEMSNPLPSLIAIGWPPPFGVIYLKRN